MKNSHGIRDGYSWATLPVIFVLLCATAFVPNTVQTQDKKEKKKVFTDEDLKVEKIGGKWKLQTSPDFKQADDPSAPVIITYVNMFFGQGKYAGLVKILEAKIENRSQKLTQSIQLRWVIVSPEEPETVLLEGLKSFPEVRVEANSTSLVDIPPVYFNKIVKPLLKDGGLTGTFRLMVGVEEVRFADGTAWRRTQQAAFLKIASVAQLSGPRLRHFEQALFFDLSTRQRPKPQPLMDTPCEGQPRLFASAVSFVTLQLPDPPCRENRICSYNPATNKNLRLD